MHIIRKVLRMSRITKESIYSSIISIKFLTSSRIIVNTICINFQLNVRNKYFYKTSTYTSRSVFNFTDIIMIIGSRCRVILLMKFRNENEFSYNNTHKISILVNLRSFSRAVISHETVPWNPLRGGANEILQLQ